MGLLSLTKDGVSFLLDENDITRVYSLDGVIKVEYLKANGGTLDTIVVEESLATIDAASDQLIELTSDGVAFLLNYTTIRQVLTDGSGSKVIYEKLQTQSVVVEETPTEINALINTSSTQPLTYKALLSQNAPIASQTSGTLPVGSIWTIEDYKEGVASAFDSLDGGTGYTTSNDVATTGGTGSGLTVDIIDTDGVITTLKINSGGSGYTIGDTITVTTGNADATFEITEVLTDDFSNMELISGTMNTTGAVIRATVDIPTAWVAKSDLSYDGTPYIVSTDSNGELNPFVNTLGETPVLSYGGVGQYKLNTLSDIFLESKTRLSIQSLYINGVDDRLFIYRNQNNEIAIDTASNSTTWADGILYYTSIEIEVYP